MSITINPTRLERTRQLNRERVARRGHKLLKDKSTEMIRNLHILEKECLSLREKVQAEITRILNLFKNASAFMTETEIENAIQSTKVNFNTTKTTQNIMGLIVPHIQMTPTRDITYPEFITTPIEFDKSVYAMQMLAPQIVELGTKENAARMLEREIQTLRRRINALEHAVIPKIRENVRYITFKLAENERGNLVRLMKVKEMHEQSTHQT